MIAPQVRIREQFLSDPGGLFAALETGIAWDERMKARKTASFGVPFNYSGISYPLTEMHPLLVPVCDAICDELGYRPNNCLANYYRTGKATMGFHADATDRLAPGPGVAIVSLGAERAITFRSSADPAVQHDYPLTSGSLLYMPNDVQQGWLHAVQRAPGAGPRISLTFREIVAAG